MNPLGLIPLKAWLVAGSVMLAGLAYWKITNDAYERGRLDQRAIYEQHQKEASDAAQREVDRLRGGADRSRVQQFDRD